MTDVRKRQGERKEYFERKKKLAEVEKNNFERIIIMRATRGYWMAGGHTAIILANKVAPVLKLRVAIRKDTDFDVKFKHGIIVFRNVDFYKRKFDGADFLTLEKETEDFISYRLKERVPEEEYELLAKAREVRRQKLESMIVKSIPMPKLHMRMTEVLKTTYKFYQKRTDVAARAFIVDKFADEIRTAHKMMIMICREEMGATEGLMKMKALLNRALCDMNQIEALEIWTVENCTLLATMMVETLMSIETERKKAEARGR